MRCKTISGAVPCQVELSVSQGHLGSDAPMALSCCAVRATRARMRSRSWGASRCPNRATNLSAMKQWGGRVGMNPGRGEATLGGIACSRQTLADAGFVCDPLAALSGRPAASDQPSPGCQRTSSVRRRRRCSSGPLVPAQIGEWWGSSVSASAIGCWYAAPGAAGACDRDAALQHALVSVGRLLVPLKQAEGRQQGSKHMNAGRLDALPLASCQYTGSMHERQVDATLAAIPKLLHPNPTQNTHRTAPPAAAPPAAAPRRPGSRAHRRSGLWTLQAAGS